MCLRCSAQHVDVEDVDDGVGARPDHASRPTGSTDRLAIVGGTVHVAGRPGDGTRLIARVPRTKPQ